MTTNLRARSTRRRGGIATLEQAVAITFAVLVVALAVLCARLA